METMPGPRRRKGIGKPASGREGTARRIDFPMKEEAVAVAQESEFLAVNQKIRVRIPAVTPSHARYAEAVEAADCNPALARCKSGGARQCDGAIV
jgi:hypothetical protein